MRGPSRSPISAAAETAVNGKGLKSNAISFLSNIVFGVASAAPAYSLASALGVVTGFATYSTPGILIVAFIPMLFVAMAYFYMNRADPDCGTVFSWVTRAMGPHAGWIGGWALIVTNILVMPNLAAVTGQYSFQLFGYSEPSSLQVTLVGVAWIAVMTAICYLGIELSARTQQALLGFELAILLAFALAALVKVYTGTASTGSMHVAAGWFNPFAVGSLNNFTEALLVAVFIYWGWDSGVSVNEETKNPRTAPGRAAVYSTILLVAVYVLVTAAALAFAGPDLLAKNRADIFAPIGESVLGLGLGKLLIAAVLISASASTQTSILPVARTALSMAEAGAIPKRFGDVHPRYLSPGFATLVMGGVSIAWYVGLTFLSKNVLDDSILALGLCIAFYYALTGFACAVFHRRQLLKSTKNFVFIGVLPAAGGVMMLVLFIASCLSLSGAGSTKIFGIGAPLAIGAGAILAGFILMGLAKRGCPKFFRRTPEVSDHDPGTIPVAVDER